MTHSSVVQLLVASPSAGKVNQSGIAELRGVAGAGGRRLGLAVCSLPIAPSRRHRSDKRVNGEFVIGRYMERCYFEERNGRAALQ